MSRVSLLSSPLLLGFEDMERLIDRVGKGGGNEIGHAGNVAKKCPSTTRMEGRELPS